MHDFNNDNVVDINDAYDLMYVGKVLKTDADYMMQTDALLIKEALNKKKASTSNAREVVNLIVPELA